MKKVRIIYPSINGTEIAHDFHNEAMEMQNHGFFVGVFPQPKDDILIYRGPTIRNQSHYPGDYRYINNWEGNMFSQFFSKHFFIIEPYTIPTFIVEDLNDAELEQEIKKRGWRKVFVRSDTKSLYFDDITKCIWPNNTFSQIKESYNRYGLQGPYAIRLFIDNEDIFYDEQRYWVLNGKAYHPLGHIPNFVKKVAIEIYNLSGSKYFTIDVAGDYIVEVNPGESSDRGCENPLDFFCNIFATEFL